MNILNCESFQAWVETEVRQPIERKINKTIQQCKKNKCKKWCLCCNKWWCWLTVIFLTIYEFIITLVLQLIVFSICFVVNGFIDVITRLAQRLACVVSDGISSLFGSKASARRIDHIFVLMLENRSFDHMLGMSHIQGFDASTGAPTSVDGLTGAESNLCDPQDPGSAVTVSRPAEFAIPGDPDHDDPPHEFRHVFHQLTGAPFNAAQWTGQYPQPTNAGFVQAYASGRSPQDVTRVMHCYLPQQLPVLVTLAQEFAVCDRWFSSLPGPTWPNRYFVHGASSAGLDDSPSDAMTAGAELFGFPYSNGSIFDRLDAECLDWEIFAGDKTPQVLSIAGMTAATLLGRVRDYGQFASALQDPDYAPSYVFIEPDYGNVTDDFTCGNCQHPLDDVTRGESLIKSVYEAIRNSPHWDHSVLIITWDEHGGFFDHVVPPPAVAPGDPPAPLASQHGFDFKRLGARVPAVVISPLIPRNRVDHTTYDHASVLATVERNFGLDPLTNRDAKANDVLHLFSLSTPRTDAPTVLPNPADSGLRCRQVDPFGQERFAEHSFQSRSAKSRESPGTADESEDAVSGDLRGFLHVAFLRHYEMVKGDRAEVRDAVVRSFQAIRSKAEARQYIESVRRIAALRQPDKLKVPRSRLVTSRGRDTRPKHPPEKSVQ